MQSRMGNSGIRRIQGVALKSKMLLAFKSLGLDMIIPKEGKRKQINLSEWKKTENNIVSNLMALR